MKLCFPENYTPVVSDIESHLDAVKSDINMLATAGFEGEEIISHIEKISESNIDKALAFIAVFENTTIEEQLHKRVSASGEVSKVKRKSASSASHQKLSAARRKEIARKAAKSRKSNPSSMMAAKRKRREAMAKRRQKNIKQGQ